MPADTHKRYLSIVNKPYGMIVCSGPTGSGKTTTLYATLGRDHAQRVERDDDRGSGGVRLPRGQPDADQPASRCHVRQRSEVDPATGPRRDPGRRDPRRGDGPHRRAISIDRARRDVVDSRHRRDVGVVPPDRHGHRAVPDGIVTRRRRRPATGPQDLPVVRHGLRTDAGGAEAVRSTSAGSTRSPSSTASVATTAPRPGTATESACTRCLQSPTRFAS